MERRRDEEDIKTTEREGASKEGTYHAFHASDFGVERQYAT